MNVEETYVPAGVGRPGAPGSESAGPPLTDLVWEMRRAVEALEGLYRGARLEAQVRYQAFGVQLQLDANGDGAAKLFEVPGGATGYLMHCALDEAGVTPAAPDTSATLWHAIYASAAGGTPTAAQLAVVGNLLDCTPMSPTVDAQIPFVYLYGAKEAALVLVGPGSFYLVVDAATASRQCFARGGVLVEQPEP